MTILICKVTTLGTPVPDPDGGPLNIGYTGGRSHFIAVVGGKDEADEYLADYAASNAETIHKLDVVLELEADELEDFKTFVEAI